jgi:signal transduction histidine kinase
VGSLDLVREGRLGAVTHDQQEFLDSAVESCSEMVEMIDTLLDVHKLEAGKMAIAPEPNDPADLLQGVVEKYQAVADRMQISLSLEVAENLPSVAFDRSVMTRLVGNLLSNAFKFTDEQGKIQITVRGIDGFGDNLPETLRRLYKEKVAIDPGTGFLMISVTDNGIGIPSDALENIFDRFAQAKNRQKGKTRGTGLGLTFCRKVMDAHHGYIWAESTEGQGSTFSLLLPGSLDENRDNNATTGARYEQ